MAAAVPVGDREPERVVPEPARGTAVPAALAAAAAVSGLVAWVPFAVCVAWLVAGRRARPVLVLARPRLVGAAPAVAPLGAVDAAVPFALVAVSGVPLVATG